MAFDGFKKKVPIEYKKSDWKMDPKGYFLIDLDRKMRTILVAHCLADGTKESWFEGSDPIALYYTILKNDTVSLMTHAAYLGQELEKAYIALSHGLKYVQDDALTLQKSDEDVHTKEKKEKVEWHRADEFKKRKEAEYGEQSGAQYH